MRLAIAGDWHANADWAEQAIAHAAQERADAIVHLGDYGYQFTAGFRNRVELALAAAHLSLYFVDGNHENFPVLNRFPVQPSGLRRVSQRVFHLPRGYRWEWAGLRFLAVGGAYSVDRKWREPGLSWWPEEEIRDDDVARAVKGGTVDVLVSHDCPQGVDIPGLDESANLFDPVELLRANGHRHQLNRVASATRPSWIWHGHYHVNYATTVDLGYGPVQVRGLDMDGTSLGANVSVVDVELMRVVNPEGGEA